MAQNNSCLIISDDSVVRNSSMVPLANFSASCDVIWGHSWYLAGNWADLKGPGWLHARTQHVRGDFWKADLDWVPVALCSLWASPSSFFSRGVRLLPRWLRVRVPTRRKWKQMDKKWKLPISLHLGLQTDTVSLPPYSIGQKLSQSLARFKGMGHRLQFSVGGVWKTWDQL